MSLSKIFPGLFLILFLASCGQESTSPPQDVNTNNAAIEEANQSQIVGENSQSSAQAGTYCYSFTNNYVSIWSRLDIDKNQQVEGELHLSNYSAEASYSAYANRLFTGTADANKLRLAVTTTIEGDISTAEATWSFTPDQLITADETLSRIDCDDYADHLAFFEANPPTDLLDLINEQSTGDNTANEVNNCASSESVFLVAETKDFWVNICGGDLPHSYVGVSKKTGEAIRLDLSDYDNDGSYFEAKNGDYTYMVIFGTAKGSFLTVTQGDQTIMQEPLTSW